ncbi:stalk domain-containing protein [Paenibacillus sp. J2TS4]|uniref:stalk domain-containing protein n=1 Tax=Paenibacillus sp. J2TS4 TaxID=2807194 RepID=UPI001B1550F6|nr:stalk domain-containing protein [Paenibacillus sp. J2TS4]GIP34807.1 hypothetical protein J2TS4_40170 [Paenibacillus sp. J2TS4]
MKKKVVVLASTATLALGLVAGATAAPVLENISAHLNWGIQFKVNGQDWTAKNQEGNKLAPITYNDDTYLPARALAEALGTAVDWDNDTQTVIIGERLETVQINLEKIDAGYSSKVMATTDKQYTVQNGVDYKAGAVVSDVNSAQKDFKLVPDGKYQKLELDFFGLELEEDVDIKVYGAKDTVLKHVILSSSSSNRKVDLDIGGLKEVKVEFKSSPGASETVFTTGNYR